MKGRAGARIFFSVALLVPLLWGCRDSLLELVHHVELAHHQEARRGNVQVQLGFGGGDASRTIAPSHVPVADLADPAQYTLRLTGSSDMGDRVDIDPLAIRNDGRGGLDLSPGAWDLTVTVTEVATSREILEGHGFVIVVDYYVETFIVLEPIANTGSVEVTFTLPQAVVQGLNPAGNRKTITVALYDVEGTQQVQNTRQTFEVDATPATSTVVYNADGSQVPAGQYTVKLTAPFTGANSVQKEFGWKDILHVEGNRRSVHSVTLPGTALGKPTGKPTNKAKSGMNYTVKTTNGNTDRETFSDVNITGTQRFTPYGDGLWIWGANWDGQGGNDERKNGTWGNEVLLVTWDPVFDAEYYELELLLHPRYGYIGNSRISNGSKFETLPTTDAEWTQYEGRQVDGRSALKLVFSGDSRSGNYYQRKRYTYNIYEKNTANANRSFTFLAWRAGVGGGINQTTVNGSSLTYTVANSGDGDFIGQPDGSGVTRFKGVNYRIGLEGECNALAILLNSFTPQHWYGIRVRAVNACGYSDWVYWKGGKNNAT